MGEYYDRQLIIIYKIKLNYFKYKNIINIINYAHTKLQIMLVNPNILFIRIHDAYTIYDRTKHRFWANNIEVDNNKIIEYWKIYKSFKREG